ncbi:MAG: YafY family protein [Rhodanobacteraceae bacterium]
MPRPTTRVLAVLELLQSHGRISGPELARRVDVDVRTLRRYIVMLEEIGVPITAERGRHGAYLLIAGYKLPPMMFTDDEGLALSMGLIAARSLGMHETASAIESAQAKLERVMPERLKRRVRAVDETVRVELARTTLGHGSPATMLTLTGAAKSQQRVHLSYRSAQGADSERDFDPYGLAFRAGAWYVVGRCHLRKDLRSFRLDRIRAVHALDVSFPRPDGFDALECVTRGIATLPRAIAVEVVLHTDLGGAQAEFLPAIGLFEPLPDGVLLRSRTDDLGWFARQLARVSFDFEILSPTGLRDEIAAHATRLGRHAHRAVLKGRAPSRRRPS